MSSQQIIRPSGENYSVDVVMATEYGIEEAFLIRDLQFWIRFNRNKQTNFIEGRTWSYRTLKQIADHFPFLNERKIQYALQNLEKMDVILKGNFNKSAMDKTCWYAFVNEEVFVPSLSEDSKKSYERQNCSSTDKIASSTDKIVLAIPDAKPDPKSTNNPPSLKGSVIENPKPDKKGEGGGLFQGEWQFMEEIDLEEHDKKRVRQYPIHLVKQVLDYVNDPENPIRDFENAVFYYLQSPERMRKRDASTEEKNVANDDIDRIGINQKRAEKIMNSSRHLPDHPTVAHGGHQGGALTFLKPHEVTLYFSEKDFENRCTALREAYMDYLMKLKKAKEKAKDAP